MPETLTAAEGEADLVRRLKQGQAWASNQLVTQYQARLLKLAYGITLDHEESREIVQDVLLQAISKISGFRGEHGLWPWLRKITVNVCLNWKRKWKRRFKWHHISLEPVTECLTYTAASEKPTPETRLEEKQEEKALDQAVRMLPESLRAVFVLNTVEQLSYRQISKTLGIREGTVSSRLHRARQMIVKNLEQKGIF